MSDIVCPLEINPEHKPSNNWYCTGVGIPMCNTCGYKQENIRIVTVTVEKKIPVKIPVIEKPFSNATEQIETNKLEFLGGKTKFVTHNTTLPKKKKGKILEDMFHIKKLDDE